MPRSHKASKRVPLARRYTIAKKAKDSERKQRRAAKKNPTLRKKLRKDLGIPNLNPFKAQILKKLEAQHKIIKFQEQVRQRKHQEFAARRNLGGTDELAGLAADAVHRASAYEGTMVTSDIADDGTRDIIANARAGESTRRAFYRQLKAVMEKADIILEVLDARDPLACRAPAVEALALAMDPPKRIVLVLNKIDLVPAEVVQKWLVHLRKEFPAVAFKASTQQQRSHLAAPGGSAVNQATEHGDVVTGSGAAGADTLLQLLKNYSRSHDLKTSITVGVVGYPNVGKSSVINSMKRSKAVGVSSTPGFTKNLQEVSLDAKVTLIDCPGIIFDDNAGTAGDEDDGGAGLLLRNCISVDAIDDPETAVDGILKRCAPEKLMSLYAIPAFDSTNQFLTLVAGARGKVAKGGVADKVGAAKSVLQDWNSGKIPFFVLPPDDGDEDEGMTAPAKAHSGAGRASRDGSNATSIMRNDEDIGSSAIISQWAEEFDMNSILKAESAMLAEASAIPEDGNEFFAVSASAGMQRLKPTSAEAREAAARIVMADMDDDEVGDLEDDEVDEEEDDEEDDEDDDDDEDDEEGDEDDEEEDDEPMVKPTAKRVGFAASTKPPAPVSVKKIGNAVKAGTGKGSRGSYDFKTHFKRK